MSDNPDEPKLKVPLGLKPSLQPTIDALLRRARNQLQLLHSGQARLGQLIEKKYLRGARLCVEDDQYILVAPIPDPPQSDLVGYPPDAPLPSAGRGEAANDVDGPGKFGAEEDDSQASAEPRTPASAASEDLLDLGAALDALLSDAALPGAAGVDVECVPQVSPTGDAVTRNGAAAGPRESVASAPPRSLPDPTPLPSVEFFSPIEAKQLGVDQTLNCAQRSSSFLNQVTDTLATSSNPVRDIHQLERRAGLKSAPSRHFIASRQQELVIDVDGRSVSFVAPPVRLEVPGKDVVQVQVRLLQTKAENDVLRADVLDATGTGVPGGVATLGAHDVRYTRLDDFQRGVLLILRGAGQKLALGVREGISTTRLERNPALVVDPGDWSELKQLAMAALAAAVMPQHVVPGEAQSADNIGDDADAQDDSVTGDDDLEAA